MNFRDTSMAGPTMHTGWMKKISVLEEANKQRQREIQGLVNEFKLLMERVKVLEEPAMPTEYKEVDILPIKRGPGRPRKNPQ